MTRSIDRLKDRWLLVKWYRGRMHFYRGAKKYPTEQFELAYSYPSAERAAKQTRFMYSGGKYKPMLACKKTIFKLKLKGIK